MSTISRFREYLNKILPGIGFPGWDFSDKATAVSQHVAYMLARTQSMFRWIGLPDTIPARSLELYLQTNGNACFARVGGKLYAFFGGLGGTPDPYYMPTIYTIANPGLNFSGQLRIHEECAVVPNDSMYLGLLPLFRRYASGIMETELSIFRVLVISRARQIVSAADDRTR